ncbi:MAG TPA: LemA family protein [Terriglobia bacterium]|nr:LemA family protein [Terriglobia bacterium]
MHGVWLWLAVSLIVLAIVAFLAYLSSTRRSLLRTRIEMDKTWAGIDASLKQRHDEIPKLLGTCRGYMPHDHEAFGPIIRARSDYQKARTMQEKSLANIAMTDALEEVFKIAADYPGLKSNTSFVKFKKQNTELENNFEEQQEIFNDLVRTYNRRIHRFPGSMVARRARLEPRQMIPNSERAGKT